MAILIDPPMWPAHGTLWSHLISDRSYSELHDFAARLPLPRRGFDLDHYDVPEHLYDLAVQLGAQRVGAQEIVHRLRDSGLRVKQFERDAVAPVRRMQYLRDEWTRTASLLDLPTAQLSAWIAQGDDLLNRWLEPHRHYHDVRHLEDVLLSLDQLQTQGEHVGVTTHLAAWFHDAAYEGVPGQDEAASAKLAVHALSAFHVPRDVLTRIHSLILATFPGSEEPKTLAPHLFDADLAIFAAPEQRYDSYRAGVRLEYRHVPEEDFKAGRAAVLERYLDRPAIYRSTAARSLWEKRARANLSREITSLRS